MTRGETGWAYNVDQFLTALDTRSDYLMPDNEDFRQGYTVGYAHAYGDVSDLKAKLMAMKEAIKRIGNEASRATSRDYATAVSACQKIADIVRGVSE